MLQLKLSYGTEKISCLMSRHYIECLLKGMLCSQCSVTAGTNQSQWIINGCEKAGRDGKNLGKHRTNNSK